jgi:hypothetical protein
VAIAWTLLDNTMLSLYAVELDLFRLRVIGCENNLWRVCPASGHDALSTSIPFR